jgi:hypothetical protein
MPGPRPPSGGPDTGACRTAATRQRLAALPPQPAIPVNDHRRDLGSGLFVICSISPQAGDAGEAGRGKQACRR